MMNNETLKAILARRSVRLYRPDPIPADTLAAVLEAGQAAPYVAPDSRHFSVLRGRAIISQLSADAAREGMKISDTHRKMFSTPGFDGTYGAPLLVVVSGNKSTIQYEGVAAASIQNMLIAAQSLGLGSCWAYFPVFAFHGEKAGIWREMLAVPLGYEPCGAVLLGYSVEEAGAESGGRYKNTITYI